MPPADSAALIVARFLKSNNYDESYEAFITEAGLPRNAGDVGKGDLTLETLLEEKKTFDLSVRFEKLGSDSEGSGWTARCPIVANAVEGLPDVSNLLSLTVEEFTTSENTSRSFLLATSASRRLHVLETPLCELRHSLTTLHDSPILCCVVLRERVLISSSMSGAVVASDLDGKILDKRRDHRKYVVKVAVLQDRSLDMVATAGWDNKINVYTIEHSTPFKFGEPTATITLATKPEALLLMRHPETSEPVLIASRTDSNFLYYYSTEPEPRLLGKQNLAPHSNAWVAFTPSALAISPTDPTLIAVGTNSLPHMKLLIVRLLVPPYTTPTAPSVPTMRRSLLDDTPVAETQASQARGALVVAERESAAIIIHSTTMAPQTAYSTPAIAWRPDASGVYVNGDDGAIRGIEASTGKVKATLRGHEEGSKVRCLWAGMVDGEEWLVSGGFDQKLIVWKDDRDGTATDERD